MTSLNARNAVELNFQRPVECVDHLLALLDVVSAGNAAKSQALSCANPFFNLSNISGMEGIAQHGKDS